MLLLRWKNMAHQTTEERVLPKRPSDPPALFFPCSLLSPFLIKLQPSDTRTRLRRAGAGMRRALPLIEALGRHRFRHCGLKEKQEFLKKTGWKVDLCHVWAEIGSGTSKTNWVVVVVVLFCLLTAAALPTNIIDQEVSCHHPLRYTTRTFSRWQKHVLSFSDRVCNRFGPFWGKMHLNAPKVQLRFALRC